MVIPADALESLDCSADGVGCIDAVTAADAVGDVVGPGAGVGASDARAEDVAEGDGGGGTERDADPDGDADADDDADPDAVADADPDAVADADGVIVGGDVGATGHGGTDGDAASMLLASADVVDASAAGSSARVELASGRSLACAAGAVTPRIKALTTPSDTHSGNTRPLGRVRSTAVVRRVRMGAGFPWGGFTILRSDRRWSSPSDVPFLEDVGRRLLMERTLK
jgi:hypothetical protein